MKRTLVFAALIVILAILSVIIIQLFIVKGLVVNHLYIHAGVISPDGCYVLATGDWLRGDLFHLPSKSPLWAGKILARLFARKGDGKMTEVMMNWPQTFSPGDVVSGKYTYGQDPAGKTTKVRMLFGLQDLVREIQIE